MSNLITISGVRGFVNENYLVLGKMRISKFDFLNLSTKAATEEEALEILKIASILFYPYNDPTFNTLYRLVAMEITRRFINTKNYQQNEVQQ